MKKIRKPREGLIIGYGKSIEHPWRQEIKPLDLNNGRWWEKGWKMICKKGLNIKNAISNLLTKNQKNPFALNIIIFNHS